MLSPEQSSDDVFQSLDSLFRQPGTSHERTLDTLVFRKRDQAAQDKMAVFDDGVLRVERGETGCVLRYRLTSRILLFCFLAPLLFLGISELTIVVAESQKLAAEAEKKAAKTSVVGKRKTDEKPVVPMNAFDKALGAPAPPPKKALDKDEEQDKLPTPTSAYVLAATFAILYIFGRVFEDRWVKALFRKRLLGTSLPSAFQ